jgi:sulfopyruvate decarboxylase TPP-binding subunit
VCVCKHRPSSIVGAAVTTAANAWPDTLFSILVEADIRTVAYVPDAGHTRVLELAAADERITSVPLTTEEEGIGYLAGAWLGGLRGALLMQSSGVGNCINTLALAAQARFPLLMLVTMRGEWAELNPWQNSAGGAAEQALQLMGVRTWRADQPDDVEPLVRGALAMTFAGDMSSAVLLGQRLIGSKVW